jgi:membrane protease YdiL (CAAX protease family)
MLLDKLHRIKYSGKSLFAEKWSLVHVWIAGQVIIAGMFVFFICSDMALSILRTWIFKSHYQHFLNDIVLLSLLPQNILLVFVPVFYIVVVYGEPLSSIGFRLSLKRRDAIKAFCYGLVLLGFGWSFNTLLNITIRHFLGVRAYTRLVHLNNQLGNGNLVNHDISTPLLGIILLVMGTVVAPIGEEFFFRGFLYNAAKKRYGVIAGIILSSAVFALVHGGPLLIPSVFPVGVILAYAYEKSGNLWTSVIMHGTFNGLQLLLAIIWKIT